MRKNIFIFVAIVLLLTTEAQALLIRGTDEAIDAPAVRINRVDYVPLDLVARAYGFTLEWDSFAKTASLRRDAAAIKLLLGTDIALVNESALSTRNELRLYKGILSVPKTFPTNVLEPFIKSMPRHPAAPAGPAVKLEIPAAPPLKYAIRKIAIDAGHGGRDPGAIGREGTREKDVVLDIALRLKEELQAKNVEVIMTRDKDVFIPLTKRAELANDAGCDFFISIHANASRARRAQGFEVYYLSEAIDDNARALEAAENASLKFEESSLNSSSSALQATLWDMVNTENRAESVELGSYICSAASKRLEASTRGVKRARFVVLKGANMPAVLVEVGFISNKKEAARLANPYYRQMLAETLASGIMNYKNIYERTDGFTK